MLGNLVGGFVTILVGVTLAPTVADQVAVANQTNETNITGTNSTILGLTTLFYVLGVASVGIMIASQGLRAAGMLN